MLVCSVKACTELGSALVKLCLTCRVKLARFDRNAVQRSFGKGDQELVLLPLLGSSLTPKFSGSYEIESRLCETD